MIIINADDWGRSQAETDAAFSCQCAGRITAVSAMVFMQDSERAAGLANAEGMDVGLHLNLSQRHNGPVRSRSVAEAHERIVRFMSVGKYAVLLYKPKLRKQFEVVYRAQVEEFYRLYDRLPSHIDGHQHRHLCANLLVDTVIPRGEKVRRNFSFWPGEKCALNRAYRSLLDWKLARKYRLVDYFFSLSRSLETRTLERVFQLARTATVELMTHPIKPEEYAYLHSNQHLETLSGVRAGTFGDMSAAGATSTIPSPR